MGIGIWALVITIEAYFPYEFSINTVRIKLIALDSLFFTKSMPHSLEFIAEMKQKLETELALLTSELNSVAHKSDGGDFTADYPDYGRNEEDNATEVADFVATAATTEATEARLKEVQEALERLAQGNYGITAEGEEIPEDRLRANPAATTIIKRT